MKLSTLYSILLIIPEADEADDNGKYNNHHREYKIGTSERKFAKLKESQI